MSRMPRIHIEKALYYVTSRGDNNEDIFTDSEDYQNYSGLLKKYKEQYGFRLFAYCLLPNHLHLLIELKEGVTISQVMHDLSSNYTKYFNGRHNRKGHLFQERYKMVLIEKEPYLLSSMTYIHLNPSYIGIAQNSAEYMYSSYPIYVAEKSSFLDMKNEIQEAQNYLKGKNYADFIAGISKNELEILGKDLTKKTTLGSDEFIEKVKAKIEAEKEKAIESAQAPEANKRFVFGGSIAIIVLTILAFYLYGKTAELKEDFKKELGKKEREINVRMVQEKQKVVEDLDERYRADKVSYEAMAKRLDIEKNRVKELEKKTKQ